MRLVQPPMQQRHQNYPVITPPKGLQKWDHQVITPPMVPQVQNSVSPDPPLDMLISTPISISHTPRPPPQHIIIVQRGFTFRDTTLGTSMHGEILTSG